MQENDEPPKMPGVIIDIIDPQTGEPKRIALPLSIAASLLHVAGIQSIDTVKDLAWFGAALATGFVPDEQARLIFQTIDEVRRALEAQWRDHDEMLLEGTYQLLRTREISRDRAAELASIVLGRTITTDTFRKRVDRYAESKGLRKVEIYKRQ